jgi:hypothetical protein
MVVCFCNPSWVVEIHVGICRKIIVRGWPQAKNQKLYLKNNLNKKGARGA